MKNTTKKQAFDYELIAMSFHESGHAVCAIHNFLQVFNVHVMTPKNREGNTDFFVYCSEEDEELHKIFTIFELQTIYSGLIAEKMYYKDICGSSKFPMHLRIGSATDMGLASGLIRKNKLAKPGKNTLLLKRNVHYDVEQLLAEHWDAVRAMAHALYKKKKLSFEEVKFILTRKTDHKDFWKDRFKKIKSIYSESAPLTEMSVKDLVIEDAIFSL